jgi:thioredoxin-dependent peroxiredoxin
MTQPGDAVEDFTLPDQTGTTRSLSELLADGPVVLFFYPAAMTTGCTRESCHFRDLASEFKAVGASPVGISVDPVEKQAMFSEKHGFGFPLLSDSDKRVAGALGVASGFRLGPVKRSTFVIGQDRHVLAVIKSELNMNKHADEALAFLRSRTGPSAS